MKRISFILLAVLFLSINLTPQEINPESRWKGQAAFFKKNIGKEIIVNIKYNDITVIGVLEEVLKEGIVVYSKFNKIFIPYDSIAFAKVKLKENM